MLYGSFHDQEEHEIFDFSEIWYSQYVGKDRLFLKILKNLDNF